VIQTTKKGELGFVEIIALVLAAVVAVVSIGIFMPPASHASRFFSTTVLESDDSICLLKTKKDIELGKKITDTDNDRRDDGCDICVNGKNTEDRDKDGMPDCCDKYPDDSTKIVCGGTLTKDERCICQHS